MSLIIDYLVYDLIPTKWYYLMYLMKLPSELHHLIKFYKCNHQYSFEYSYIEGLHMVMLEIVSPDQSIYIRVPILLDNITWYNLDVLDEHIQRFKNNKGITIWLDKLIISHADDEIGLAFDIHKIGIFSVPANCLYLSMDYMTPIINFLIYFQFRLKQYRQSKDYRGYTMTNRVDEEYTVENSYLLDQIND